MAAIPTRVLETVLTARNLLSPTLAKAGADVAAFNSTVAASQGKAATSATTSAQVQDRAATKIATSNVKASTSAQASAAAQSRAQTQAAQSATVASRTQMAANDALIRSNGLLGTSLTPLTAGLGATALALGYAGYRGMEFDAAMSQVQAASQASAGDIERLRDAAIKAGADTKYSGEEAAQGITELAKAGVSTADVLDGGLKGALNLAAAGQMEVADAAETAATALSVFRLEGSQTEHVADLLAAGAGKAQGTVHDLSQALNQSALVAAQLGLSVEDTTGALAMFAYNGLTGSDAGTSFKTMLQALTPNSEAASRAMDSLGISAFDAQGNFVGLEAFAGQLRTALGGLTEEQRAQTLETIFGSDAVRAASVLYKEGSAGVAEWAGKVNDAGYAQRQAAQLTDNLRGDLERLGGAFDSLMTEMGSGAQGPMRETVQMLTSLVGVSGDLLGFFGGLPGPVQLAVLAFGAWALAGGKVMDTVDGIRTRLVVFREEQELQRALYSAQQASLTTTGASYDSLSGRIDATTGVSRGLGTELDTVSTKAATARAALGGLGRAIGPSLGFAAATWAIASLADGIMTVAHSGDAAAKQIDELVHSIESADTNPARFSTIDAGLDDLRKKAEDTQAFIAGMENQNFFNKNVWENPFSPDSGKIRDAQDNLEQYRAEIDRLEGAHDRAASSTQYLTDKLHLTDDEVVDLADKYKVDLTGGVEETRAKFEEMYSQEYGDTPVAAANATGTAMQSAKAQTEEAIAAQEKWIEGLASIGEAFVDPLSTYKGLLEEKKAAEQASAEATAASTESAEDSWKDYVTEVDVSLDEYALSLEQQIENQKNWRTNLGIVTQRAGLEVGQILASMGAEGVDIVAAMATGTDAEMQRAAAALIEQARLGGSGAAAELDYYMKMMQLVGASGGKATADEVAKALGIGVAEVERIASQYGVVLGKGIAPILNALGLDDAQVQSLTRPFGDYAEGGYTGDGGKYEPKGVVHGGEFVFTKEQTAAAGIDRLEAYANSLQGYATGGFVTAADVPRPPSTAPYRPPISTAGDATMQKGFDEVRAWLDANAASGPIGSGAAGGSWQALWAQVHGQFPTARLTSSYRPGDPGYHGKGKAVDVAGARPGDAASMLAINRWAAATMGASLAELIHTPGINLWHGQPHTYNADTRADHYDHVHLAAYEKGTNYVPETGMALLHKGEAVVPASLNPAAMPGYGAEIGGPRGGGAGSIVIHSPITFAGPVYGGDAMRRIAEDVVDHRDRELQISLRSMGRP